MKNLSATINGSHYSYLSNLNHKISNFLQTIPSIGTKYKLRKVAENDNWEVKGLIQKILLERGGIGVESLYYDRELDHLFDVYNSKGHLFNVLIYDNEIVGTVGLGPVSLDGYEAVCEIRKLYLHREYRNQGQGKMMFEKGVKQARKMGYKKCLVTIEKRNVQFYEFLVANGFKLTGSVILSDAAHEVCMVKNL